MLPSPPALQQMRRRSSLDDVQLKLLQQQHQQQPDLEEFKPSKSFARPASSHHVWFKAMVVHLVLGIGMAVAICLVHHVAVGFSTDPVPTPSEQQQQPQSAGEVLAKCLENVTRCDKTPLDKFRLEWPDRFLHQAHDASNPLCGTLCAFLFEKSTTTSGIRSLDSTHKLTQACQIGCQYAAREFASLGQTNCQFDCKNTVWVRFPQRQQCNYHTGLGLATVEFERRFGEGVFGTGKACEAGCILGNSRPCPQCDWDHRLLGV